MPGMEQVSHVAFCWLCGSGLLGLAAVFYYTGLNEEPGQRVGGPERRRRGGSRAAQPGKRPRRRSPVAPYAGRRHALGRARSPSTPPRTAQGGTGSQPPKSRCAIVEITKILFDGSRPGDLLVNSRIESMKRASIPGNPGDDRQCQDRQGKNAKDVVQEERGTLARYSEQGLTSRAELRWTMHGWSRRAPKS